MVREYRISWEKALADLTELITLAGFKETILAPDGTKVVYNVKVPATEIAASAADTTDSQFIGGLPFHASQGYGYKVEVSAIGWIGSKKHPGQPLNLQTTFRTQ